MLHKFSPIIPFALATCGFSPVAMAQTEPGSLIYSGEYDFTNNQFKSLTFVNSVVGWDTFFYNGFRGSSTVIGNVEGGNIWFGHEAFVREPGATTGFSTYVNPAAGAVNELDFHATTVGHVLAGSGYNGAGGYTYAGLGMAPEATLVSGGIATGFSNTDLGSFSTTEQSTLNAYQAFFTGNGLGAGVAKPDVINSSWGGGDPAAMSNEIVAIDGLARQNATVAFVVSAGNGATSTTTDPVSAPASGFNNISVGSLGGASFLQPSTFSSRGLTDFYNPVTHETVVGVRAAVDIAAPGEVMFLAAYLGNSGSIGAALPGIVQQPSPTDQYFVNMDGTSYAAPMVAGGIALLKDAAKRDTQLNFNDNPNAFDTRVIKSVLMAGAQKTVGWNNGQNAMNVTTQALDLQTGAGAMNLDTAATVYLLGTRDAVPGQAIGTSGWDSGTVNLGSSMEYVFGAPFTEQMSLTVALNWFSQRGFDSLTQTGTDLALSNLDLQVWSVNDQGDFLSKVGESKSTYNNTEFLRFDALAPGQYGLKVTFDQMVFDATGTVNQEAYGLAWSAVIPEPGSAGLMGIGLGLWVCRRHRRVA